MIRSSHRCEFLEEIDRLLMRRIFQMEIESTVSNPSSNYASRSSSIDEWEDVLKSVDADQAVPEEYKLAFRLVIHH